MGTHAGGQSYQKGASALPRLAETSCFSSRRSRLDASLPLVIDLTLVRYETSAGGRWSAPEARPSSRVWDFFTGRGPKRATSTENEVPEPTHTPASLSIHARLSFGTGRPDTPGLVSGGD